MAGFSRGAGQVGAFARRRGAGLGQLQHRPQFRPGRGRNHRGGRGRDGCVCGECLVLHSAVDRILHVEAPAPPAATSSRTTHPRHHLGCALRDPLAADPHRDDPCLRIRPGSRRNCSAHAARGTRPAERQRKHLWLAAGRYRRRRSDRRAVRQRGPGTHEGRARVPTGRHRYWPDGAAHRCEPQRRADQCGVGGRRRGLHAHHRSAERRRSIVGPTLGDCARDCVVPVGAHGRHRLGSRTVGKCGCTVGTRQRAHRFRHRARPDTVDGFDPPDAASIAGRSRDGRTRQGAGGRTCADRPQRSHRR